MRDPWFPIIVMLVVILVIWLGIDGPLFASVEWAKFGDGVYRWQTLIGASVALLAATIAWINASRQIRHVAELEVKRRSRKQMALRAVLPLGLSAISEYAEKTSGALNSLRMQCVEGALPDEVEIVKFPNVPSDTIETMAEFIEFSDDLNVRLFEKLLARIQVQSARISDLASRLGAKSGRGVIQRHSIEGYIIDAASIYAGAAAAYDYARQETEKLPSDITWDSVRSALRNMYRWKGDIPGIYEKIDRFAEKSSGPK